MGDDPWWAQAHTRWMASSDVDAGPRPGLDESALRDLRGALRALESELVVRGERAVDVDVAAVDEVLRRDVAVVGAEEVRDLVVGRPSGALPRSGELDRLVDQLCLGLVRCLARRR